LAVVVQQEPATIRAGQRVETQLGIRCLSPLAAVLAALASPAAVVLAVVEAAVETHQKALELAVLALRMALAVIGGANLLH
jgi:hypothetical protein